MVLTDTLANVYSKIMNYEKNGKKECLVKPSSIIIRNNLRILQENRYIGEYEEIMDGKGNLLKVNLLGHINKCGVIKPRHAVRKDKYEKFEKRYLPSRNFGILIVSTSKGIMAHSESKKKGIGGKLLAYCY